MTVCCQEQDGTAVPSCFWQQTTKCTKADDGQKGCPKHVVIIPIKLEFSASVGLIHKESVTMQSHDLKNLYKIKIKAVFQLNHNVGSTWLLSQDRKELKCKLIKLIYIFPNSMTKHVTEFKTSSTYQLTWQESDIFIRILHVFAYMDSNSNMYSEKAWISIQLEDKY